MPGSRPSFLSMVHRRWVTGPRAEALRHILPQMSRTEQEALESGTVWRDAELFSGRPDWRRLLALRLPELSDEERAFLEGPVEQLCGMLNDWRITHVQHDLTPEVWRHIHSNGFLGLVIPRGSMAGSASPPSPTQRWS